MPGCFANPLMYWIGFDINNPDPVQRDLFQRFYLDTHVPEVVASNPGFVHGHLYQRQDAAAESAPSAPTFLAVYEMDGEAAAQTYLDRNDGPPEGRPKYTPGPPVWKDMSPVWRMVWRRLAESAPAGDAPEIITVVGTLEPSAAPSNSRVTTWELVRELRHPAPGSPPFALVDEQGGNDHAAAKDAATVWNPSYRRVR
jgi:hypothetical protein